VFHIGEVFVKRLGSLSFCKKVMTVFDEKCFQVIEWAKNSPSGIPSNICETSPKLNKKIIVLHYPKQVDQDNF